MRSYSTPLIAWSAAFAASCTTDDDAEVVEVFDRVGYFDPCIVDENCPLPTD